MSTYSAPYLWIDGERILNGRASLPVVDPSTGEKIAELPCATADDLEKALRASQRAFETWRNTPALDRSRILNAAAFRLR